MELLEWFYNIDYSSPVSEKYEYKTNIIESWDGTEQRHSLLDEPDHTLYNNYVLHKSEWHDARNKLNGHREKAFLVPNRNIHFVLRGIGEGYTYLTLPTWPFRVGSRLLLKDNLGNYSVHEVSYVGSDGVSLSNAVPRNYDWCECVRLDTCFLSETIDFRVLAGDMVQATVAFKADEGGFEIPVKAVELEYYDGLPVLDFKHNFSVSVDHSEFYDDVGAGWGATVKERINRSAGLDMRMTFELEGEKIQSFKAFMHEVRGRQGVFWVEDHSSAFYVSSVGSGTQLKVEKSRIDGVAYLPHKVVALITEQGVYRRKIVDVIPGSEHDTLVLDESIPAEAHASIVEIKYLYVARFLNDDFEYDFYHDQYARLSKSVRAVRSWQPA